MTPSDRARLSPFPVDPEILARIRPMTAADAPQVAALHRADMGASLWAQLGEPFLRAVYVALIDQPDFLGYVYEQDGRIRGFIAGSSDSPRMLSRALRRRPVRIALASLRGVLRRPSALRPLLDTLFYFRRTRLPGLEDVRAESMFCSFAPELRGKRISGLINKVLFDELARRGHRWVKITTDAGNEASARQLASWGFERVGAFRFYGKEMVAWRLDLSACERVQPPPQTFESAR